jgi:hypothetical protein
MVKRLRLEDAIEEAAPANGRKLFKKGDPRPEGAGRKKGQKNKMSVLLKDAILLAAECEGRNGMGLDGLVGALRQLFRREPAVFGRLLEKLLPYQLTGKDGSPMQMVHSTKDQIVERFKERGLPLPPSLLDMPAHGEGDGEKAN